MNQVNMKPPSVAATASGFQIVRKAANLHTENSPDWAVRNPIIALHFFVLTP